MRNSLTGGVAAVVVIGVIPGYFLVPQISPHGLKSQRAAFAELFGRIIAIHGLLTASAFARSIHVNPPLLA